MLFFVKYIILTFFKNILVYEAENKSDLSNNNFGMSMNNEENKCEIIVTHSNAVEKQANVKIKLEEGKPIEK